MASSGTKHFGEDIFAKDVQLYDKSYCWENMTGKYLGKFEEIRESVGYVRSVKTVVFEHGSVPGGTDSSNGTTTGDKIKRCVCKGNKAQHIKDLEEKIIYHARELAKARKEIENLNAENSFAHRQPLLKLYQAEYDKLTQNGGKRKTQRRRRSRQ